MVPWTWWTITDGSPRVPEPVRPPRLRAVELPDVLSVSEVAEELRVSRATVYWLCETR